MELIAQINGAVNSFVWGAPMLILLIGVGILMTVRNKGLQFRKFGYAMKNTIGKIFKRTHAGRGRSPRSRRFRRRWPVRLAPETSPESPRRLPWVDRVHCFGCG